MSNDLILQAITGIYVACRMLCCRLAGGDETAALRLGACVVALANARHRRHGR